MIPTINAIEAARKAVLAWYTLTAVFGVLVPLLPLVEGWPVLPAAPPLEPGTGPLPDFWLANNP